MSLNVRFQKRKPLWIAFALLMFLSPASAQTENVFTRGNVNDDFEVNRADADYLYDYLYNEGATPLCMDAADVNDDGIVDNADYLTLRDYLSGTGPEPKDPFPNRGWDLTDDSLSCLYPTPAFPTWPGSPSENITISIAPGSQ